MSHRGVGWAGAMCQEWVGGGEPWEGTGRIIHSLTTPNPE